MTLPIVVLPRREITLPSGATMAIRSLSRAEALVARSKMPDVAALEIYSIAQTCEVSEAEASEWHAKAGNEDVEYLIEQIAVLSGLSPDVGKADAEG